MLKIRRSRDRLIYNMGIPIPGKDGLYIEMGPSSFCLAIPRYQGSRGPHGAHLGPVGPRWAPCGPHEPCYQGLSCSSLAIWLGLKWWLTFAGWQYIQSAYLTIVSMRSPLGGQKLPGPCLNIKTVFPGMGISIWKIRWLRDYLVFIMGIPLLLRWNLYIEMDPRRLFQYK